MNTHAQDDPEARALEEEITRGTVYDRNHGTSGTGSAAAVGKRRPERDAIRTGTLVWGIIALLVALVVIAPAVLGGLVLAAGGIPGATRKENN